MSLQGIITSMVTPFTEGGGLDEEGLEFELRYQIESGVHGVCVLGGTGEFFSVSASERERVVEIAATTIAGSVPLIVGCFITELREFGVFARRCHALGVTAVMLTPPPFYNLNGRQFELYCETLASESPLPLVLYNAPARAGTRLSPEEIAGIATKCPSIIGVKDTTGDITGLVRMRTLVPAECALLQGLDSILLPSLAGGVSGGILAGACVSPDLFVRMYDDWRKGRSERAHQLHLQLAPLMEALELEPMPVLVKEAMHMLGRGTAKVRPPLSKPHPNHLEAVRVELERLAGQ
jgi:4-hydroxy-tetrahydrodipicolinate synthase